MIYTTLLAASPAVPLRKIPIGVTGRKRPRAMPLWNVDGRLEEEKTSSAAVRSQSDVAVPRILGRTCAYGRGII